jgi:hypothetical protein
VGDEPIRPGPDRGHTEPFHADLSEVLGGQDMQACQDIGQRGDGALRMETEPKVIDDFSLFHPTEGVTLLRAGVWPQEVVDGEFHRRGVNRLPILKANMGAQSDLPGEVVDRRHGLGQIRYRSEGFGVAEEELIVN